MFESVVCHHGFFDVLRIAERKGEAQTTVAVPWTGTDHCAVQKLKSRGGWSVASTVWFGISRIISQEFRFISPHCGGAAIGSLGSGLVSEKWGRKNKKTNSYF